MFLVGDAKLMFVSLLVLQTFFLLIKNVPYIFFLV